MSKVTTSVTVSVAGSKSITASSKVMEAEATGNMDIALEADDATITAELQPSAAAQIRSLLISSNYYGPELTYVFSDGSDSTSLTLDGPHLYSAGNLAAMGVEPQQLKLTMTSAGEPATVSVFVARDATP